MISTYPLKNNIYFSDGYNRGNGYGHSHGHGHRRVQHYRGANEYRPYGNVMNLDNGHFGYDPNDGTYGQPHKHNVRLDFAFLSTIFLFFLKMDCKTCQIFISSF